MFRRKWSGLPADPVYADNLKDLGYFINDQDEVRSIANPKCYYKFFSSKNERWNERQRFHMNTALEQIIHTRLHSLTLTLFRLPLSSPPTSPHTPILLTPTLPTATRTVLLVGEALQDLGILAHRIIGGPGGIDRGSIVSSVRALLAQRSNATDPRPPAIVVANPGQNFWWPEGQRALTEAGRQGVVRGSAVSMGVWYDEDKNGIPGSGDAVEHVGTVFREVLSQMPAGAKLDVIGIGSGAEAMGAFLNDEHHWAVWGPRMECLALVGGFFGRDQITVPGFADFLEKRARAYVVSTEPAGTPIAGAGGNEEASVFTGYGCPVFSSGEKWVTELMFVEAGETVLGWVQQVAMTEGYVNPVVEVSYRDKVRLPTEWGKGQDGEVKEGVDGKMEMFTIEETEKGADEDSGEGGVTVKEKGENGEMEDGIDEKMERVTIGEAETAAGEKGDEGAATLKKTTD